MSIQLERAAHTRFGRTERATYTETLQAHTLNLLYHSVVDRFEVTTTTYRGAGMRYSSGAGWRLRLRDGARQLTSCARR